MQKMTVRRVTLSKKQMDSIPEPERILFVLLGHLYNESSMLHKLLIFSQPNDGSAIQQKVHSSLSLLIARVYIGKLFEGWKMLNKVYFSGISKENEPLLEGPAKSALLQLKQYFGKKNLIEHVRNNYSFHYSPAAIAKQMQSYDDSAEFEIFLSEAVGTASIFFRKTLP